ncbi:AlkA N-terminal domain-containing protein [Antrihabitans sp. YC2-6]|uniref:AlkA N-terminal domain-containing protein n=1 Tax=Antrihabitans sp. YC2-6 TaxID=2799498 RepID=UPI0018F39960|nr:AlkA N-terminal domain-containing protein [Antrihabitans sp. YC2-6]MBJ8343740.1 DNA-3-methyladenine glycosylase 2 family protein [Antrihabitans sp. YC2-6]
MHLDFDRCYRAVSSKDSRFDGQFFTAVRTTGIYCRPSCPAITPKPGNVVFMPTAAAAQHSGFRACRRCLPDAAPGSPQWNIRSDLAARSMRLISDGVVERGGVEALGAAVGYSTRQLTRVLTAELGAGPLALARAHRAHTARLLIQTTRMPMSDIAFAAGFASIRQFNDTIRAVFAVTPTRMREESERKPDVPVVTGTVSLRLPYRAPLDATWFEWFLSAHAVPGVESWADGTYTRSLRLPHGHATASIRLLPGFARAELSLSDMRDLAPAVARLRHLLDLDADPAAVDEALAADSRLAEAVSKTAGIRVPGNVDGAELLLRTMIGQQISLAAASTHTARLVDALGEPIDQSTVTRLFPTAEAIAVRGREVLTGPARRIDSIVGAAEALASGRLDLHCGRAAHEVRADLLALPGIGPWTADYVTMRLLADPDILLSKDLVVRQGAAVLGIDLAESDRWKPWRSYLSMHLWRVALNRRKAR